MGSLFLYNKSSFYVSSISTIVLFVLFDSPAVLGFDFYNTEFLIYFFILSFTLIPIRTLPSW